MLEKLIEGRLRKEASLMGGKALKFVSPGMDGVPDRIVLMPHGKMAFVEVKAPGEEPRPLQLTRMRQLQELGFRVYVIDSALQIKGVLDEIRTT